MIKSKGYIFFCLSTFLLICLAQDNIWGICINSKHCPSECRLEGGGKKLYTAPDASCRYHPGCCEGICCDVNGNCECCNGNISCLCSRARCTPVCNYSHTGTDADGDGWDKECGDCKDSGVNAERIYPENSNEYCDCDASTPAEHPSSTGIPETTACECTGFDPSNPSNCIKFSDDCLCLDHIDNDCDGDVDLDDDECPLSGKDWVVAKNVYLDRSKNLGGAGLYVMNGFTLTIASGVTLTVGKDRGVHLMGPGAHIVVEKGGRIDFN